MNDRNNDVGAEERELLKKFGTSFEAIRANHPECPKPEILLASGAGVLDEETAKRVGIHLEKCGFCQILLRDLADGELLAARADEERRVRERVLRASKAAAKAESAGGGLLTVWFRRALPVAALACVVLAVVIWVHFHQPIVPISAPATVTVQPAKPAVPSVLQWEKLPIKLQASSVLVLRGKPRTAQEKYSRELTAALAYYRDDNFEEAVQQLAKVAKDFPRGAEAQLYLGISQLKLEQNPEAIAPLVAAQQLGPEENKDDATWYLALAYMRAGDQAHAVAELQKLCGHANTYSERACASVQSAGHGDKP
jgi:tetratricopeptide (TPR) repeat protein